MFQQKGYLYTAAKRCLWTVYPYLLRCQGEIYNIYIIFSRPPMLQRQIRRRSTHHLARTPPEAGAYAPVESM